MTASEIDPGHHNTFIFDRVVTNNDGNCNHHTGIFSSTESGVYVFSWTVFCYHGRYYNSQLILNSNVVGGIACYAISYFLNSASSVVVLQLNSGDVVNVRTHPTNDVNGKIFSGDHSRTSFAGWKII